MFYMFHEILVRRRRPRVDHLKAKQDSGNALVRRLAKDALAVNPPHTTRTKQEENQTPEELEAEDKTRTQLHDKWPLRLRLWSCPGKKTRETEPVNLILDQ